MTRSREALVWTAVAMVLGLALLCAFAVAGWPGTPIDCTVLLCYCEASAPGLWKQPVNTWSNVAPLFAAVAVAHDVGRPGPVALPRALGLIFSLTLVFQGLGSMFFHASLMDWAGAVDAMSMFAIIGLLIAVNLFRGGALTERGLLPFWLGFSIAGMGLGLVAAPVVGNAVGVFVVAVLVSEVWLHRRDRGLPKRWFRAGVVVFGVGVAVWHGSAIEGMPLCEPSSVWQGHALWHVTSAAAIAMFFVHARRNLEHVALARSKPAM
mgnify:CR=1 FL=1